MSKQPWKILVLGSSEILLPSNDGKKDLNNNKLKQQATPQSQSQLNEYAYELCQQWKSKKEGLIEPHKMIHDQIARKIERIVDNVC